MIYGYARISTNKQSLSKQVAQLEQNECEIIYSEVISGTKKISKRKEFQKLLNNINENDTLIVTELDRLGRYEGIYEDIKEKLNNIKIVTISNGEMSKKKMKSNFNRAIEEVNDLKNRAKRRKKGNKKLGRPNITEKDLNKFLQEYLKYKNGEYGDITIKQFGKKINKGRSTCFKYIKILKEKGAISK